MINGFNPIGIFLLPTLGYHPDDIPRYRDCFMNDEEYPEYVHRIHVYTRVGGGNRDCGMGEEELMEHENYVTDFDDSFDSTYATYVFSIPDKWKSDIDKVLADDCSNTSDAYKELVKNTFPKIKENLDVFFSSNNKEKTA